MKDKINTTVYDNCHCILRAIRLKMRVLVWLSSKVTLFLLIWEFSITEIHLIYSPEVFHEAIIFLTCFCTVLYFCSVCFRVLAKQGIIFSGDCSLLLRITRITKYRWPAGLLVEHQTFDAQIKVIDFFFSAKSIRSHMKIKGICMILLLTVTGGRVSFKSCKTYWSENKNFTQMWKASS